MRPAALLVAAALAALCAAAAAPTAEAQATPHQGSTPPWPPGTSAPPNLATQAMRQACAADTRTLCSGVQPGAGRILQCFKEHAVDLSPDCRAALTQLRDAGGGARRGARRGGAPS